MFYDAPVRRDHGQQKKRPRRQHPGSQLSLQRERRYLSPFSIGKSYSGILSTATGKGCSRNTAFRRAPNIPKHKIFSPSAFSNSNYGFFAHRRSFSGIPPDEKSRVQLNIPA
ncbi:MAG: hypothetical protein LBR82_09840 [Desulfovibrio sp.]|nr:hypothetical protein [Desulfovibrio sp.]